MPRQVLHYSVFALLTLTTLAHAEIILDGGLQVAPEAPQLPALRDQKFDLEALKKLPNAKYIVTRLRHDGVEIALGTLAITTTVDKDKITFKDTYIESRGGAAAGVDANLTCTITSTVEPKASLTFTESKTTNKYANSESAFTLAIKQEKATLTYDGPNRARPREFNFPNGTVSTFSLFRIIPLLPRDAHKDNEGLAIPALYTDNRSRVRERQLTLRSHGLQTVDVDGKRVKWTHFTIIPHGMDPDNVNDREKIEIWLDDKGLVRELYVEDFKYTLDQSKPEKKDDKKPTTTAPATQAATNPEASGIPLNRETPKPPIPVHPNP